MSNRIKEFLDRPVSPQEAQSIQVLFFLLLFSLPLIFYYTIPAWHTWISNLLSDSSVGASSARSAIRTIFYRVYPISVAGSSFLALLPLGLLASRGSRIALVGEGVIMSTGLILLICLL